MPYETAINYSPGRWRALSMQELNNVALWVSHIVIAHRNSKAGATSLRAFGWAPDKSWPDRSEAEALSIALQVASEAAKAPERFEELARRYSDDVVTRDNGGSLGGIRAGQLPAQFIDALAVLKPGQVSKVVQTPFGYHIIKRRPVPPEQLVSGKRLVVRYAGTYGAFGLDEKVTRSRDDALTFAEEMSRKARVGDVPFSELVRRYGDNADMDEGGDMGVWSSRDPEFSPAEVERLGALRVGEVSEPLDSPMGFQVLLRTEVTPRPRFAAAYIQLQYDPSSSADQSKAQQSVFLEAKKLAKHLVGNPAEFDRVRREICCEGLVQWSEGRGRPGVTPVIRGLAIGEIASTPVEGENVYNILRRIDVSSVPEAPPPAYEVPSPKAPNLDAIVRYTSGTTLAVSARSLESEATKALALAQDRAAGLTRIMDRLAATFEASKEDADLRVRRWHAAIDEVRGLLGPKDFSRFEDFLNEWTMRQVLSQPKW